MVPTVEQMEDWLEHVEEYVLSSLSAATPDMPNVREAAYRLWVDVSRHAPAVKELKGKIPGLGDFELPPPPPPPPVAQSWTERSVDWARSHPWTVASIGVGAFGAGLLVGYGGLYAGRNVRHRKFKVTTVASEQRRQVVVLLGADCPIALPLIHELENDGYIVVASVATPEAADDLERKCGGYVRALVLNPHEPATVQFFVRSLASTLSRRFPINAPGDPHASPATQPHIHSVISLLSLAPPPPAAPFESISVDVAYLPYLTATHLTPIHALQSILPLLRSASARDRARAQDAAVRSGLRSLIVCVPVRDARVGLPYASAQAMSAAATVRGAEVLRREINAVNASDRSSSTHDVRVVVVDVGDVGSIRIASGTAAEKTGLHPATSNMAWDGLRNMSRAPSDPVAFAQQLVDIVNGGRGNTAFLGLGLWYGRLRNWIRGNRVAVGAGAGTHAFASYLPSFFLDVLLNLPHLLIGIRNAMLPVPPRVALPPPAPAQTRTYQAPTVPRAPEPSTQDSASPSRSGSGSGSDAEALSGSEADVESNTEQDATMGESWVSLRGQQDGHDI